MIVEFEYEPFNLVYQCLMLMSEMISQFFPIDGKRPPPTLQRHRKSCETYVLADTLEQYLLVFNEMRKRKS